jgi:hypothetical protein
MSVEHLCRCDVCRAKVERMTMTATPEQGTELATDRLRKLAARIAARMYEPNSLTASVKEIVFDELRRACFNTFREGIILADQSVVEQLAVALEMIEELGKACDFHIGACNLNDERVRALRRQVEDLANDRAAADTEAAKLRQQLEASRADAKLAHTASTKATSDICGLQGQLWTQNGTVDRLTKELAAVREVLTKSEAMRDDAVRRANELRDTLRESIANTNKAIQLLNRTVQ